MTNMTTMTFFLKGVKQVLSFLFIIGFCACIFINLPIGLHYLCFIILCITQRNTIIILKDKCSILEKQALEKQALEKQALEKKITKSTQTDAEKTEKSKIKKTLPPPPPIEIPPWKKNA